MQTIFDDIIINWGSFMGFLAFAYFALIVLVIIDIIWQTESASKTIGYLLLILFIPLLGIIIYYSFGVNYRNNQMYSKKLETDDQFAEIMRDYVIGMENRVNIIKLFEPNHFSSLGKLVASEVFELITSGNNVDILSNGENAFPKILAALREAKETIHLEYYIVRNDKIASEIKEILIQKAQEGVEVRFIYDDFGSSAIRGAYAKSLKKAGVKVFPFRKIHWIVLANRLNYRNHRKIIVIDGKVGFVGGMNIGDEYINTKERTDFYRDMHLKVEGPLCYSLQYVFLCDWQFCSKEKMDINQKFFPLNINDDSVNQVAQIAASGPDSRYPMIMYSLMRAIFLAKKEILITTPYFVPSESIMEALKNAALSGVKVKLLVPYKTNSLITQLASTSYYEAIMDAGIEIYRYKKGFIHAKTSVFDGEMSMVGTANMDNRSFYLNFEVNAILYDKTIGERMRQEFFHDLESAEYLDKNAWAKRSKIRKFIEKLARLASALL